MTLSDLARCGSHSPDRDGVLFKKRGAPKHSGESNRTDGTDGQIKGAIISDGSRLLQQGLHAIGIRSLKANISPRTQQGEDRRFPLP